MRSRPTIVLYVLVAMIATLSACAGSSGSGEFTSAAPTMPSVVGQRLDVAYSDLAYVGVAKDAVEVVGGGTFGVIDESNWQVCQQRPDAGAAIADVRLVIDRTCPGTSGGSSGGTAGSGVPAASPPVSQEGTMPDVVGMVLQDAQDMLQSQGSYLLDQQDASGQGRLQLLDSNWKVCSQAPAAGAELTATTVVTLAAVKLDETCP